MGGCQCAKSVGSRFLCYEKNASFGIAAPGVICQEKLVKPQRVSDLFDVLPFSIYCLCCQPHKPFPIVTSVCTVDLLILNCLAAALTVASFSIIYSPSIIARSSTVFLIRSTPSALLFKYMPYKCRLYCRIVMLCNKARRNFVCAGSMCCRHCALSPLILHYG